MTISGFVCPIDGLVLGIATADLTRVDVGARESGSHVHVAFDTAIGCLNGHDWRLDEMTMTRTR